MRNVRVKTLELLGSQSRYVIAAAMLSLAMLVTALMPLVVSAAQLNQRSIALSNSSVEAKNVEYEFTFTAATAAESVVIDFCSDTPLIGEACVTPTGLDLTAATSTGGTVAVDSADGNLTIDRTITDGTNTFSVTGITNPEAAETMYVRIMTYALPTDADGYTSVAPGSVVDSGSVAVALTNTIGVSGAVLETLTFCVAKIANDEDIANGCADANDAGNAPVLTLGQETSVGSGVYALTPGVPSTGVLQTQISTNAAGGAVVRLKNDAAGCGGLLRLGSDAIAERCIEPAMGQSTLGGAEFFGVRTDSEPEPATFGSVAAAAGYNATEFKMNYDDTDATGVTSLLGDPFLTTNGQPVGDANMSITFGASATNQTAAGVYAADLRLIATGTF